MNTTTPSSRLFPVSPLLVALLLSPAVTAAAQTHGGHASSHGDARHGHVLASMYDGDAHGAHGRDGMSSERRGSHHARHSSGHGKRHSTTHGKRGMKHTRTHQSAAVFIDHVVKFKDGMSLTDSQVRQLREIKTQYKKRRITLKADVQLANIDLHEVVRDEQADLADIETHVQTIHALKTKIYMASIKAKRNAKAVLSEEQRSRMKKIHERIKAHGDKMSYGGDRAGRRGYQKDRRE